MKVVSSELSSEMVSLYGVPMELKECKVADQTGLMRLKLWGGLIGQMVVGSSYIIKNVSVRCEEGVYLTTTPQTSIQRTDKVEVPEELERQLLDTPAEELLKVVGNISGLGLMDKWRCSGCQKCQEAFDSKGQKHRCVGCRMLQWVDSYVPNISGSVDVVDSDGTKTRVTLTMSGLLQYLKDNGLDRLAFDLEGLEDHLMEAGVFCVTYTKNGVIASLEPVREVAEVGDSELLAVCVDVEEQPSTSKSV